MGKTSLGQSIARALQRPFVRVSLGGVHDEAEIRGHRRTYVGALPGNIVQGLRKAGARDCVMMLDEVDKLGAELPRRPVRGAARGAGPGAEHHLPRQLPGRALRPQPRCVFIATANVIDNVPAPVRDRMEVIELPGYTQEEKLQIAQALPGAAPAARPTACSESQCELTDEALRPSSPTTRARPACASSSARSAA